MARPRDLQIAALVLGILVIGFSLWWFSNRVEGFQDGASADPDLADVVLPTSDVVGIGFLIHGSMNEITSKVPFFVSSFKSIYNLEKQTELGPEMTWAAPNAVPQDNVTQAYLMVAKEPFTLTPAQLKEVVLTLKTLSRQYFNRENAIALLTEDGAQYPTLEFGSSASAAEAAPEAPLASEASAAEEAPLVPEASAAEEEPAASEAPAAEEAPMVPEEPVASEAPLDTGVATEGFYQGLLYR